MGSKIKTPFLNTSSVNKIFSDGIKYLPPYPAALLQRSALTHDLLTCGGDFGYPLQAT